MQLDYAPQISMV